MLMEGMWSVSPVCDGATKHSTASSNLSDQNHALTPQLSTGNTGILAPSGPTNRVGHDEQQTTPQASLHQQDHRTDASCSGHHYT
ncbi:hypothetical protein E2C01_092781 [Portunus trituberculatus]|uniref:Uncharacterized protein n=1 Tax=Portunus trituberculatus TaxID=210409 RepID=A0A5B7JYM1_PORTR|nr:hypothetical protein [Portunus trituberculatus]